MNRLIRHLCILFISGLWALAAQAQQLIVFGDSLSDGGNAALAVLGTGGSFEAIPFLPPPYGDDLDRIPGAPYNLNPANPFAARFSNGPVWVEQLSARYGLALLPSLAGGTNYAFGGANSGPLPGVDTGPSPTLRQQTDQFLASLNPAIGAPSDAVYVVFGGGNDVRAALTITNYPELFALMDAGARNLKGIVDSLVNAGAREIVVALVPNVGLAPDVSQGGFGKQGTIASATLNLLLVSKLASYRHRPDVKLRLLDSFGLVTRVARNPANYGLTEVKAPCLDFGSICGNPDQYLFWDGIHPTQKTHGILADEGQRLLAR